MTSRLFAIERYDRSGDELAPESLRPWPSEGARLMGIVHLPADEVLLVLVEGTDVDTVAAAAAAAGLRIDRINPATWISPARTS